MTTIVLDVNETLLDLEPVRGLFSQRFGDATITSRWFGEMLRAAFVSTIVGEHPPFTDLAAHALDLVTGAAATAEDRARLVSLLGSLPPHPDVPAAIAELDAAGHTIAAVTNSPINTATAQLTNAGLAAHLDLIMSVDEVGRFKPHPAVYVAAAERLGTEPSRCLMVAAHDWDIAGAMAAGYRGVFVERAGTTWNAAFGSPTARVRDLWGVAALLDEGG